jgi:TolB protein
MEAQGTKRSSVFSAVVVIAAVLTLAAPPAHATFPGLNGKIAFHSNRDGNFEIYSMDANGSNQTRLTSNAATDVSAAWSADGTKIAFASNRDGNFEIYTMNADGTGQTRITNNAADDVTPGWSPDGTQLVFGSLRDGNGEIYTMNSNGTGVTRITTNAALDGQANWSADGSWIAFTSNRDGNFEIYMMLLNGTSTTRLSQTPQDEFEPAWSPAGAGAGLTFQFQTVVAGQTTHIIAAYDSQGNYQEFSSIVPGELEHEPTFSPDNTKVAFSRRGSTGEDYEIVLVNSSGTSSPTAITANSSDDGGPDWQPVARNYARPSAAPTTKVYLVPAYKQCTTPNAQHKGVITNLSCNPPSPASSYLTVGTPDFNGAPANATGSVALKVFCNGGASGEPPPCSTTAGDQLDGNVTVSQTDVRCQGTSGSCPNGALSDYVGNLRFELLARITDRNSTGATGAATIQDVPLAFNFSCVTTPASTVGSTCSTTTSFDAVLGGTSGITEGKRAIWDLDDIRVYDGGADGVAATTGDNTLFVSDGLFFP